MPLEASPEPSVLTDPGTLALVFSMNDLMMDHSVRVIVEPAAIVKLGGGANPLSVFELHRAKIESIASGKFDHTEGASEIVVREDDVPD